MYAVHANRGCDGGDIIALELLVIGRGCSRVVGGGRVAQWRSVAQPASERQRRLKLNYWPCSQVLRRYALVSRAAMAVPG